MKIAKMKNPRPYGRGIFSPCFVGFEIPPKRKALHFDPRAYARGVSRSGIKNENISVIFTSLDLKKAVAGKMFNCTLKITIGKVGFSEGGSIKVLFRAISDAGIFQFTDSHKPNFVGILAKNKGVVITPINSTNGLLIKLHERPWWNGFILNISKGNLNVNDEVFIVIKKWQMQTFVEENFKLQLFTDTFNTGLYTKLNNSPTFEVIEDKPSKVLITAPTTVAFNKSFKVLIKITDKWGNVCRSCKDRFQVATADKNVCLSNRKQLANGYVLFKAKSKTKKPFQIFARWKNKISKSNKVITIDKNEIFHYWADLHWQSEQFKGNRELKKGFYFAKKFGFLDVTSHQGNDFQITDKFWKCINENCRHNTKNNEHIAFSGYEWSGNTNVGGDHNVIFLNTNQRIYRSSNKFIGLKSKNSKIVPNIANLFSKLDKKNTLVIAHAGGRRANLKFHNPKLQRLVEVYSCWGLSDDLFIEALHRGYKVGVVANSDGHTLRPGAEVPGNSRMFKYQGGLTCILSRDLTTKSIFEALKKRHCYATTGSRVFMDFTILNTETGNTIMMGDETVLKTKNKPKLNFRFVGNEKIKSIEFFDVLSLLHEVQSENIKNISEFTLNNWSINSLKVGDHAIYVKVKEQHNTTWSSPIFIKVT